MSNIDFPSQSRPSRRRVLGMAASGLASAALVACGSSTSATESSTNASAETPTPDCVLTPEETEGPFYTDVDLVRSDITADKPGSPLTLRLRVIDAEACTPIPDASVDVWHADAGGLYSAFPGQGDDEDIDTSSQQFLRGVQATDADGWATFTTIYPGWYPGRTTHIHIKVHLGNKTAMTSQLYFPDEVTREVYGKTSYAERGAKDTTNDEDGLGSDASPLRMTLTANDAGHTATHTIGVKR